ncbi:NAD(P)/FAD-dependent oxidoreductase [Rasiella sp. SM2506]|uniref:NAD(P)/FAD-dependent oxidoreductase n=1 Tax=Rasiella sp. SM2506 TaxID=3423914 RepID=UPI003D7A5441
MKQVEYIIVGLGIAGICFAETLLQQGKTFVVVEDGENGATTASGGVLNPTVLKRFTAAWNASQFFEKALPFYKSISERLDQKIINPVNIHRIFYNIEEQNDWVVASDKLELSDFLSSEIQKNKNISVHAPLGLGSVKGAALLDPSKLIEFYRKYLQQNELLVSESFNYSCLQVTETSVTYKNYVAKQVVFAQGASVKDNPFFNVSVSPEGSKVFVGNKGEYVIFKAPALQLKEVLKGPMMLIPLGNDLYKVGASYGRDDYSPGITSRAKEEIVAKLQKMISCDFEVVDQVSGIRPTVKDRKPLLGSFPENPTLYFLSGLGTRGLSMAPLLSEWLYDFVEKDNELPKEVVITRFK